MNPGDRKTPMMLEIEARYGGRDIREIVADAYNRHGNMRGAARELGVSHSLIWDVVARFDGVRDVTLTFPEADVA